MANNKYSKKEKLEILAWYRSGNTLVATCEKYGVTGTSILKWQRSVQAGHPEHLEPARTCTQYSADFKLKAVTSYFNGEGTVREIASRYGLRTPQNLYAWIRKYTEGDLNSTSGGESQMSERRKTTCKERLKIVNYCLDHDCNYSKTAERYAVSYNQIYRWVRQYKDLGAEGLEDRRGKPKKESDLTAEDRYRRELRAKDRQIKELECEVALLKKLEELERESR